MRLFLAVEIPETTRAAAMAWADTWRGRDDGWRWVAPAALHVTLRFYGETPDATAIALRARVAALAAAAARSDLRVAGWGVFPGPGRPRVLWAGIDGDLAPLEEIGVRAEEDARALGFAPEERGFKPHLTLARARQGARPRLPGQPDHGAPLFGPLPVREVVLFRSYLGPSGARYEALARIPLGAAPRA